jgi:hypothetical protein
MHSGQQHIPLATVRLPAAADRWLAFPAGRRYQVCNG